MTIQVGDRIPSAELATMTPDGIRKISTDELFGNATVVMFAVPGAFTPTCSAKHLPGFVQRIDELRAKGVDTVACLSVNDVFVMNAWGKDQQVGDRVLMLADGNGDFVRQLGLEMDASEYGMGRRSKRFALIARNGTVEKLMVETPGEFRVSSAESVLNEL